MPPEHECLHEEQINKQARIIAELETRSLYKEKMIDALNENMEKINDKLDTLISGFNNFKLDSTKDDTKLELRLSTIETELRTLKEDMQEKEKNENNRRNRIIAVISLVFAGITIGLNLIFKII